MVRNHLCTMEKQSILIKVSCPQNFPQYFPDYFPESFPLNGSNLAGLWMGTKGPSDVVKGCSPPQDLEKTRKAGYVFSDLIY